MSRMSRCYQCRERSVERCDIDYSSHRTCDGMVYAISVQNLSVLKCSKCGAVLFDEDATDRIEEELNRMIEQVWSKSQ